MLFNELTIKPFIQQALKDIHFKELTPVQEQVIPQALAGKQLIVQSQTGSGKSHSFLVPIFEKIDPSLQEVQAVITAPSRELATQLYDVARQIAAFSPEPISMELYIGGTNKYRQLERLNQGSQPQIVIGTPGRIFDLMSEHALWVQTARILVIDEADMTMDLGFLNVMDEIASRMPENVQIMVFSATIPQELEVFFNRYMVGPEFIEISPKQMIVQQITNYLINTKGRSRKELVYQLLTMGHPFLALVFCNTREYAEEVANYLKEQGLKVAVVHGGLSSRERNRVMRQIRNLDYQYVVASDLAARGIDIPGTSMVINTELPQDLEYFIHRVGRTGRQDIAGTAYTFVTPDDDRAIVALERRGVPFTSVELVNGEIKEVPSRHRRQQREDTFKEQEDPVIRAMINKNRKRKVKPGYKRKLNQQIKQYRRQQARQRYRNKK
ncbi:DEAD/DEAH box helicase [Dolosicoccus paucivorans]|uniref:DEAD/DEAH box helicase n=1 Tax=Dolosicoccus paucivorans TaxID=84521 RepID=A0A2N6SN12_9LACT|nr:DEAD/DEAH box helicase [Dolosicoccus paucivorans]PMB84313.1 DEAD/DEAH box helicase [Dolosicoccus paucivorans]PMC58478.1 DEAD/DEAH box helicase [Dolosicoccus paucivorans]